jgi:hypothetical protein
MPDENPGITQIAAARCGWPAMMSAPVTTTPARASSSDGLENEPGDFSFGVVTHAAKEC